MLSLRVFHLLLNTGNRIGFATPYWSVFTEHHRADKLKGRTTFPLIRDMPTTFWWPDNREEGKELAPFDSEIRAVHKSLSLKTEDLQSISSSLIFFLKNFWKEQGRLRCQLLPSPRHTKLCSSRCEVDRELVTFFLTALLLFQLTFPKWLIFQPQC